MTWKIKKEKGKKTLIFFVEFLNDPFWLVFQQVQPHFINYFNRTDDSAPNIFIEGVEHGFLQIFHGIEAYSHHIERLQLYLKYKENFNNFFNKNIDPFFKMLKDEIRNTFPSGDGLFFNFKPQNDHATKLDLEKLANIYHGIHPEIEVKYIFDNNLIKINMKTSNATYFYISLFTFIIMGVKFEELLNSFKEELG